MASQSLGHARLMYDWDGDVVYSDTGEVVRVRGSVQFVKTDQGIWVTAQMDSQVDSECCRCLDEYSQGVHITIDEEAVPKLGPATGMRALDDYELQERLVIDENYVLDLTEPTRQFLALGLPMKLVCREDCQGLCATCGINRNHEVCTCDRVESDAKWGVLLDLIPSMETSEISKN